MGSLSIRLPESLHDRVRQLADEEGVSMNQFVMLAVAEKMARLDVEAQSAYVEALRSLGKELAAERGMSLAEAARDVLARSGDERSDDEEPNEGDRIPADLNP